MFKKISLVSVIFFSMFTLSFCSGDNKSSAAKDMTGAVEWVTLSEGLEQSRKEGKPLVIYFYTEWCTYCKQMDSEIFKDREITDFMNKNYINAKVNPEKETGRVTIMGDKITAMELMSYMGGRGFPSTVFWDKKGKPVTTFPGYLERSTFLPLLDYMLKECYNDEIRLDDYIKGIAQCSKKQGA